MKSMNPSKLYVVLMACLMERSIVIISNSMNKQSYAVIGLRALLSPFKWWHVFMPLFPNMLMDIIEAPIPILVGMSSEQFKIIDQGIENRMWVHLDD